MRMAALPRVCRGRSWLPAAVALAGFALGAAGQPDLAWIDRDAVAAREIMVETDRGTRPLTVVVNIAAEVDAPAGAIWDVLRACEIAPEYVPNVVSCRRIEQLDDGRADLFVQVIKPIFFLPTFEHVFRLDYTPYTRIDVHRVSGPIEHMEGSWWLLPRRSCRPCGSGPKRRTEGGRPQEGTDLFNPSPAGLPLSGEGVDGLKKSVPTLLL